MRVLRSPAHRHDRELTPYSREDCLYMWNEFVHRCQRHYFKINREGWGAYYYKALASEKLNDFCKELARRRKYREQALALTDKKARELLTAFAMVTYAIGSPLADSSSFKMPTCKKKDAFRDIWTYHGMTMRELYVYDSTCSRIHGSACTIMRMLMKNGVDLSKVLEIEL